MTDKYIQVDVIKISEEIKDFIWKERYNKVDFGVSIVEFWPPTDSEEYPEIRSYVKQWDELAEWASLLPDDKHGDDLSKKAILNCDKKNLEIQSCINGDKDFWEKIKSDILPLYEKHPNYNDFWKNKWKSVSLWYDPVGLGVKTTKHLRGLSKDGVLGDIVSSEVISEKYYPPGLVVKVE